MEVLITALTIFGIFCAVVVGAIIFWMSMIWLLEKRLVNPTGIGFAAAILLFLIVLAFRNVSS